MPEVAAEGILEGMYSTSGANGWHMFRALTSSSKKGGSSRVLLSVASLLLVEMPVAPSSFLLLLERETAWHRYPRAKRTRTGLTSTQRRTGAHPPKRR